MLAIASYRTPVPISLLRHREFPQSGGPTHAVTGLQQYETTPTTATHQAFALEGNRLVPMSSPQETVIGNPLDQENLIRWQSIADRQALANSRG